MTAAPEEPVASTVIFAGTALNTGAVAVTVTSKLAGVALTPALLVALHVTVVAPILNVEPDAGRQLTVSVPPAGSVAVGSV